MLKERVRFSLKSLLKTRGLKKTQDLIDNEVNTVVFNTLNGLAPEYLSDVFIKDPESHMWTLRNTNIDLQVPKKKTNNGQKCFSFRGVKSLNALPLEIKQTSSLQDFKSKLK